jgi:hypothetical protein
MGRGEATECYFIQAWESTDNHRSTVSVFDSHTPLTSFPLLLFLLDRVQVFHRGRRDTKVRGRGPPLHSLARRSNRESNFLILPISHFFRFGWFWQCPNGELCQYRHALPPGFVLRSQRKALEEAEKANMISLEEFLEVEVRPCINCIIAVTPEPFIGDVHDHIRSDTNSARA